MAKTKLSKNYKRLTKQIPDLEENIKKGKINVVPLPRGKKKPYITNWNNREYSLTESFTYTNRGGKQTQKGLKYHTGNYGILIGYGNKKNGYSIGCIDIDGYKTSDDNPDLEIKKETQKLIYEALKDLPNCIIVQTQSGGYHIYYWNRKTQPDTSITSNSLYFPKDFKIKALAGKCLNDSIEVFTNQDKKQTVLPGSQTKLKENNFQIREYKVISELNTLNGMDTVDDLNQLVIDTLVSKGYTHKQSKQVEPDKPEKVTNTKVGTGRSKPKTNLKKLSQDEITQVVQLVTPIFPVIEGKKHTGAMYLGGYFSYHITKDSSREIAKGIVNEIGTIFDNSQDFIKTVLENYDRQVKTKAGLPKLCKLIQQRDNTFNIGMFTTKLNSICNPEYSKRITRPIISKAIDISQYLENGTGYNNKLYLAYIYQTKKYVLISEKEKDFYFNPLQTSYDPATLYNRTGNANWEEIETQVKKILGNTKGKELDSIVSKIISELLENLNYLFINNHFTNLKGFPKGLKQFILKPVHIYNLYSNDSYEREEIDGVKESIKNSIENIIDLYNNHSLYITDDWLNKRILHLVSYTSKDPFLNLNLGTTPAKRYQARAGELIVKELGLKRHLKDNKETLYFYNENLKYYDEITTANLKRKLYETLGFNLVEADINAITKAISTEDILYRNLIVFGNMYFDTNTLEEFKPLLEVNTYNRQDYLTVNNIGTFNETNNTIALLDYDKELKLEDILTVKGIETTDDDGNPTVKLPAINLELPLEEYKTKYGMTLTELVLRQILIPKDNPTDIRLFRDFLERLGSNIYGSNLYKVITFYYGDGDNAKSVLNLFNNLLFNKLDYEIKPETLKDSFNLENFYNRLLITIDEVTRDSFTDLKDYLKQMTSKYSKMETRQLYSTNTFTIYGFPNITIYANEPLNLQPVEDGALFSRIDYLELPNKFVEKSELDKYNNTYLRLEGLEDKLRQDTEGLSWLITAGILCFKDMKQTTNRYTKRQTREETIEVFLGADSLTKYLMVYTEFVDDLPRDNFTSNTEIVNGYLEYMAGLNREVDQDGLSKEIGLKLNKVHPQLKQEGNKYKETGTGRTMYKLKLKEPEDITREYNEAYTINEYATDRQLSILDTNGKLKTVYKQIQKGNCTISILTSKLPGLDCLDLVQQLDSLGLIYATGQTILNEHIKEDSQ